jgi:hypothetical protein
MTSRAYVVDIVDLGCDAMGQGDLPAARKYFELAVRKGSAARGSRRLSQGSGRGGQPQRRQPRSTAQGLGRVLCLEVA